MIQGAVLGALSVLVTDRACRAPLLASEPCLAVFFDMCRDLEGYLPQAAAARREAAAKLVTAVVQVGWSWWRG